MLTDSQGPVRPAAGNSLADLAREWDKVAPLRRQQVSAGKDLSFKYVLLPSVRELLDGCNRKRVIDLGCGIGELTRELANDSGSVVGVDVSPGSIAIAQETCEQTANLAFHTCEVSEFARRWTGPAFTAAVANMSLMACPDLDAFVQAAADLLSPGGCLVATITHPKFWPLYWGYADADWFCYAREQALAAPFRISAETTDCITTHIHRPLSAYLDALAWAGFAVDRILEPYPDQEIQALYSEPWQFPRFLAFRAARTAV